MDRKVSVLVVSALLAAGIIVFMLLRVWGDLLLAIEYWDPLFLIPAIAFSTAGWWLRGARYRSILKNLEIRAGLTFSTACVLISQTANLVVPARLGDLVRIFILKHENLSGHPTGISPSLSSGSLISSPSRSSASWHSRSFSGCLPGCTPSSSSRSGSAWPSSSFSSRSGRWSLKTGSLSIAFLMIDEMRKASLTMRSILGLSGLSVVIWLTDVLTTVSIALMFRANINFAVVLLAVVVGNLFKAIPLTPGGIGTYEAVVAVILVLSGTGQATATLIAVSYYLVKNIITAVGGILSIRSWAPGSWTPSGTPSAGRGRPGRNMEVWVQVLYVLSWLVLLKFLQISVYPALKSPLGRFAYPVSFSGGILAFSALSWYLGLLRLPVALAALPFLGLLGWAVLKSRYSWEDLKPHLRWDLVFLIGFAAMLLVRLANPTIITAEKFMDHAFIASIMRSPVVPPTDPWYAGGTMNIYYYGGYWLMGILGTLTGVPSSVVFNLALPTVLALAAVSLYAIGDLLLPRFKWFPLLTLVLVNPAFLRLLILGSDAGGILWDSTRVITNTINEYTLFSFLWGDVHPHVIDIFNQVFLLLILVIALRCWYTLGRSGRIALVALASLSLGSMPVINTWDVLVYAPMTVLFGALILWDGLHREKRDLSALGFLVVVPPVSILLDLPDHLQLGGHRCYLGIFTVTTPSDPWEFLLVHGFFLAIFLAYGARSLIRRPYLLLPALLVGLAGFASAAIALAAGTALLARWERRPEVLMALAGISLITLTEFFYLKDYLGGIYYRMNTVFKFYNIAWILMGVASLIIVAGVLSRMKMPKIPGGQGKVAVAVALVILVLAAPAALLIAGGGECAHPRRSPVP